MPGQTSPRLKRARARRRRNFLQTPLGRRPSGLERTVSPPLLTHGQTPREHQGTSSPLYSVVCSSSTMRNLRYPRRRKELHWTNTPATASAVNIFKKLASVVARVSSEIAPHIRGKAE